MDVKIIFSVISVSVGLWAFYPYLKGVLKKETQPHEFTWLIWAITQGTATAGLWVGGGGIGAIYLTISTLLVTLIFLLSLKGGKKHITKSDIVVLIAALIGIGIWAVLDNPVLAVLLMSCIDVAGYIPTFRKSYSYPWTETALFWGLSGAANLFSIMALESYNLLTLSYLVTLLVGNTSLFVFLLIRRRSISNPA